MLPDLQPTSEARPIRSLDLNESTFPPAPAVIEAMQRAISTLNRYPDFTGTKLINALAARTGIPDERIFLGAGSNELLFLSTDIALKSGDEAIAPAPGFSSYPIAIAMRGRYVGVPVRPDGVVDIDAMLRAVTPRTRLAFVSSPHNPTGGMLSRSDIERLVDELPDQVLLHFDEAYYEFGRHAGGAEILPILAKRRGAWVSTRSFSKAYNLAGARIGYGIASSAELAGTYRKARIPFSVGSVALAGAVAALTQEQYVANLLDRTIAERNRMAALLGAIGLKVLPSAANFVMVLTPIAADAIVTALKKDNIFVLPVVWPASPGALRISVGTAEDTDAVVAAIARLIQTT